MMWQSLCRPVCLFLFGSGLICALGDRQEVHILFSNHLDVGFKFAGSASAVINQYWHEFFPRAAETAALFRLANLSDTYTWHVEGSWLPALFLDCPASIGVRCPGAQARQAFKDAVLRGDISWNALPFNMQLEALDAPLLERAVQLGHELDAAFGLAPKAVASQRDVPGLTRAALPVLAGQGVRVFSLGVNGGSAPWGPKNTPFLWRDEATGAELVMLLHPGGYSGTPVDSPDECVRASYMDETPWEHVLCGPTLLSALQPLPIACTVYSKRSRCLAWKGDNEGPHTFLEALDVFARVRAAFPGARVAASTWERFGAALLRALPRLALPRVSKEVGDTWIHGLGSDAFKLCEYRALLRLHACWSEVQRAQRHVKDFSRLLLKVPEHTWGGDIKTYLDDWVHWSNDEFRAKLDTPSFRETVAGWEEQRAYVGWAVQALGSTREGREAQAAIAGCRGPEGPRTGAELAAAGFARVALTADALTFESPAWALALDPHTGGLRRLRHRWKDKLGAEWGNGTTPLGAITYSTYTEKDFDTFWSDYAYIDPFANPWFFLDFGKANCSLARPQRADALARLRELWYREDGEGLWVRARLALPDASVREAGAPQAIWVDLRSPASSSSLLYEVWLDNKTATRLPEAMWVAFGPGLAADPATWRMSKLGQAVSPLGIILNGSHSLHAVDDQGITVDTVAALPSESLNIRSLDAALVSPGAPTAFPSLASEPELGRGMSFNLLNNIWGTNYPMWQPYGSEPQSLRFRFEIRAERHTARPRRPSS